MPKRPAPATAASSDAVKAVPVAETNVGKTKAPLLETTRGTIGAGAGAAKTMERHKKAKQRTRTGFIWKKSTQNDF